MPSLEIASFNASSVLIASQSGASRVELCTNPSIGGTTPSLSTFTSLKTDASIKIPIYVMIRPHGNSFIYTPDEILGMKADIARFKEAGANGFVFGILNETGRVDVENCKILLETAGGRSCTFHRAFDEIPTEEMGGELEILIELAFENVLTSGGARSAVEGKGVLRMLVEKARGRIEVIVGGGVRSGNLEGLRGTGARWFHSSAITDGGEEASGVEAKRLSELVK